MMMILTVFGYLILLLLAWRLHRHEASPYEPGHLAGKPSMGVKGGFSARARYGVRFRMIPNPFKVFASASLSCSYSPSLLGQCLSVESAGMVKIW